MAIDPYLIPGTDTLRNVPGYTDPGQLQEFEHHETIRRIIELDDRPIAGRYDLDHLCAFHRHLFQDIYDWAGDIRTVNIAKGGTLFGLAHALIPYATDLFNHLAAENHLVGLDHTTFVNRAAHYVAEINALHPFREGNGRTQRAFLHQLSKNAGWNIEWDTVTAEQNITASIAAMNGDETGFVELLTTITTPLPADVDYPQPLRAVPNPKPSPSPRRRPPSNPASRQRRR
jgi:cell filamentation protein